MANFNNIKHEIDQNVNTNGVQAITGAILNETLKDMIDEVDDKKQDTLVAGSGIAINGNVISATGGSGQTYTAAPPLAINNDTDTIYLNYGTGIKTGEGGALEADFDYVQEKLTAGTNIQISGSTISATDTTYSAGQGLDLNGTTFSVDYDEVQEKLESGQNIKTVNGYSLLGSGDIVIGGGGGGNYLPLEGGTLQNTDPGEDTELKVIDGMDEDYVKIVAPESQGEKPHVEIFENGSGDTKIYYDHIERGSQVSIDLPSSSGTLALTSDLSGYLPLTGGNLQASSIATEVRVKSPSDDSYVYLHAVDSASPDVKLHRDIQNPTNGEVHEIDIKQDRIDIERWDQSGNTWMADTLYFPQFKTGTIALTSDLAGKQDALIAGSGITIDANNVISATGGSGQSYTAGSGINIDSNNIISNTSPSLWRRGSGNDSIKNPVASNASGLDSVALGYSSTASGAMSTTIGSGTKATAAGSLAAGLASEASGNYSTAIGNHVETKNDSEFGTGKYNKSDNSNSDALKTAFSVGNGNGNAARSNSLEIKANNDLYVSGIGSYNGTNAGNVGVESVQDVINGKQDALIAGQNITIQNNVISATGGGGGTTYTASSGIDISQNNEISVSAGNGLTFNPNTDALQVDWSSIPTGSGLVYAPDPVDPNMSNIQVDTNTIQEKLVAGSNITINGNVISASGGSGSGLWVNGTGTNSLMAPGTAANPNNTAGGNGALNAASEETLTGHTAYSSSQGDFSVNFGCANSTPGRYSAAIGRLNSSPGRSSLAIGEGSFAGGIGSFAGGRENGGTGSQASGQGDFAFNGTTSGTGGYNTAIDGTVSSGTGYHNISLGGKVGDINKNTSYAVAIGTRSPGYQSEARSSYSIALGGLTKGEYSVAIGPAAITNNDYEVAVGPFNASYPSSDNAIRTVFSVGNGSYGLGSNTYRNVLEVKKNDDVYVAGIGGFTGSNGNVAGNQSLQTVLNGKQDQLTAGTGISIQGNVISATGGSGASYSAGAGITIDQNNEISANPDGSNIVLDSDDRLNLDFVGVAGNLQGTGLQVDSNTGATLEVDFAEIPSNIAGNGLQDSGNGTLEIDTTTIASDLSSSFLPLTGGALQEVDTSYPSTNLYVLSPDSAATGYIYSYSEDTSDPQNPIPAFVEVGLQGQSSGSADTTQGIYLRSNGTIAVDYIVDSQGNTDMVELELPRKASGQTYTIATLDDIQGGGGSYVAGNGINISGSTISVDTGYLDGEYLPLTGGQLKANPSDAETLLDVAAPDSTSAISMSADTIDSKLAISADKANAGISDGDTFRTVLSNTGEIQVAAKTVNPQDPTDIGETTYTLVLPQKNDTIATLSDIQGGGSSYTAGAGINIDANNVISNTAPGLWTSGTGTNSLLSPAAKTYGNANGLYAVSAGTDTKAEGASSFAIGAACKTQGSHSFAGGNNAETNSSATASFAFGQNAKAKSAHSFVVGSYSSVETNSNYSVAIGNNAISSAQNSNAIGLAARAKNTSETAFGPFNNSINTGTTAEKTQFTVGNGTADNARSNLIEAKQNNDIYVIGVGGFDGTNAGQSGVETLQQAIANSGGGGASLWTSGTGANSLVGPGAIGADGDYSIAAGKDSNAQANRSVALGGGLVMYDDSDPNSIINAEYGVAIGTGSSVETASSLAMMGGTASAQNGGSHSVAIGDGATAEGMYDVALTGSTSSGNYSFAASSGIAHAHYSTALSGAEAFGEGAFAAGQGNKAYGYGAAALGYMAQTYSQANGTDVSDPNAGEVALGRYNYSEQGIVFTVGCGYLDKTDPNNPVDVRQNAVAIDSDGKIFLKGLGGYTGTSTSGCTDLVSFLNNL